MSDRFYRETDRGAHSELTFMRCARGFVVRSGSHYSGEIGVVYAFDHIEDVAAWFVEQYAQPLSGGAENAEQPESPQT